MMNGTTTWRMIYILLISAGLVCPGCPPERPQDPIPDTTATDTDDILEDTALDCPAGLVPWQQQVCVPQVDECPEPWELPLVGGGCMIVGPRGCPVQWDPESSEECVPEERLPCPEGFIETEDGVACVPRFDEDCGDHRIPVLGGGCVGVGPRSCPKLWDPDADVDCVSDELLPCPEGWLESVDGMYCHPGWDECPEGEVPLVGGGCRRLLAAAEDCPAGPFPEAPDSATDVLYVLADSPCAEGCGAETAPYSSIQAAIDAAPDGAAILVGPGTYHEGLTLEKPVSVLGLCSALVEISGIGDVDARVAILNVQGVNLSGFRITSPGPGVEVRSATDVVLQDLEITKSSGAALFLTDESAAQATDLWIHDTGNGPSEFGPGIGIWVDGGAGLSAHESLMEGTHLAGTKATGDGTTLSLTGVVIRDTQPDEEGNFGFGIQASEGCKLTLEGSLLEKNRVVGILAYDIGMEIEISNCMIRNTLPDEAGDFGYGIQASEGCKLTLEGSLLEQNRGVGIRVAHEVTMVEISTSVIRETQATFSGDSIGGIHAAEGCLLSVAGSLLEDNMGIGFTALQPGTYAEISSSVIRNTLADEYGDFGHGINVSGGSELSVKNSLLEDNMDCGLSVIYSDTAVDITGSVIRNTLTNVNNEFSAEILVIEGSAVAIQDSLVEFMRPAVGLLAGGTGTMMLVTATRVSGTADAWGGASPCVPPACEGYWPSDAVLGMDGANVILRDMEISTAAGNGLRVLGVGTDATLDRVVVRGEIDVDSVPDDGGVEYFPVTGASGIIADDYATLALERTGVVWDVGPSVRFSGGALGEIRSTLVRPPQDGWCTSGGVVASDGAEVSVAFTSITDVELAGILGFGYGTHISAEHSQVRSIRRADLLCGLESFESSLPGQVFGDGVSVLSGATAMLEAMLVRENYRAGAYFMESSGGLLNNVITGNGSYGLALEDCADDVSWSGGNYIFGNAINVPEQSKVEVSTNPVGLPSPDLEGPIPDWFEPDVH